MAVTTLTYHKIERIEVEFQPNEPDPTYSYLQLRVYSHGSTQPDKIAFFPSTPQAADHLHDIFMACQVMVKAEPSLSPEKHGPPLIPLSELIGPK